MNQDDVGQAQRFESDDEKRATALRFAREVVETRGHPFDASFNAVREAGYTDEQIMEMVSTVALATFTNYMNETIDTEYDIPVVEPTTK